MTSAILIRDGVCKLYHLNSSDLKSNKPNIVHLKRLIALYAVKHKCSYKEIQRALNLSGGHKSIQAYILWAENLSYEQALRLDYEFSSLDKYLKLTSPSYQISRQEIGLDLSQHLESDSSSGEDPTPQ